MLLLSSIIWSVWSVELYATVLCHICTEEREWYIGLVHWVRVHWVQFTILCIIRHDDNMITQYWISHSGLGLGLGQKARTRSRAEAWD